MLTIPAYSDPAPAVFLPLAAYQPTSEHDDTLHSVELPSTEESAQPVDPFHDYPRLEDIYVPRVQPSYMDQGVDYLLDSRRRISSAVSIMGERMDAYFAGEQYWEEDNDTYLRLRVSQKWIEGGKFEPELDYKFRLDLPGTKKRYRLVLTYQEDNEQTLEQRELSSERAGPPSEQSLFAGLLRTLSDESGNWESKLSAGIKVKLPPDPFVRASGKRFISLGEHWEFEVGSYVEWFNSSGVHGATDLIFSRIVAERFLFQSSSLFDWRQENDTLEYGQIFSLFQDLGPVDAIGYHMGAFGTSYSHSRINTYYISADYRRDLYKDWLYMNVVPELAFPREEDFSGVASITLSFEIFFR
ncbi:MAG: hypothetical protein CMK89_18850 [Pseudomonadales bacterium]|nr:hypothetical protein [Pseudomonadales bacterium]